MAFGGSSDDWKADMQASALANHLGKVSLNGAPPPGRVRDVKYQLRDLEIQQTIGEAAA